jgi:hypothetical protein
LLQEFIKTEHHKADMAKSRPPPELTKNTGRPAGIVYQVYFFLYLVIYLFFLMCLVSEKRGFFGCGGESEFAGESERNFVKVGNRRPDSNQSFFVRHARGAIGPQ